MTALPSFTPNSNVSVSHPRHRRSGVKYPANSTGRDAIHASRRAFANLLWRAFPSKSERELSLKAAAVLDVSPRQVTNWLRCEHSAAVHYYFAVAAIAGAESIFDKVSRA